MIVLDQIAHFAFKNVKNVIWRFEFKHPDKIGDLSNSQINELCRMLK